MEVPATGFIEMACSALKRMRLDPQSKKGLDLQQKELGALGVGRVEAIGASGLTKDFCVGYELGLQTARVFLRQDPAAASLGLPFLT